MLYPPLTNVQVENCSVMEPGFSLILYITVFFSLSFFPFLTRTAINTPFEVAGTGSEPRVETPAIKDLITFKFITTVFIGGPGMDKPHGERLGFLSKQVPQGQR